MVFTSVTASAPSSRATRAIATTSGSTGDNLADSGLVAAARPGELALGRGAEPGIRGPDRIRHPAGELRHRRGGMAAPWLRRHRLGDDAPQSVQLDDTVHLTAEAGGTGGEQDGVGEVDAEE